MGDPLTAKQRRKSALIAVSFLAMLGYLVMTLVRPGAGFLRCPIHLLTGYSCPGCGMTRSSAHFIAGDLVAAVGFHPFGPLFVVAFGIVAVHHAVQAVRGRVWEHTLTRAWGRVGRPLSVFALVVLVLFGAVRFALELSGILTP